MLIQTPCLETKNVLEKYLKYNQYYGCEFTAANNILWSPYYNGRFTIIEDMLVFVRTGENGITGTTFPVGRGDKRKAFDAVAEYFSSNNIPFFMYLVEKKMYELIDRWYPGKYTIEYQRDDADYLYEWETLAYLKGPKLHGKRNHINRFLENYPDYKYEIIDDSNYKECIEMAHIWAKENELEESAVYELKALDFALENRRILGLNGALIRVKEKVIAFTMGEPLKEDTYVVHFEKAYGDIQGAYPMINREFVRRSLKGYRYINREEDMGIPGLRHAKTSYQPVRLIDKGTVKLKRGDRFND